MLDYKKFTNLLILRSRWCQNLEEEAQLNFILRELMQKIEGLESCALVSREGLIVSAILESGISEMHIAAMSAIILSTCERVLLELKKGELIANGYDSRIDLEWYPAEAKKNGRYNIYRSDSKNGKYVRINRRSHYTHIYSDFIGKNNQTYYYKVRPAVSGGVFLRRGRVRPPPRERPS